MAKFYGEIASSTLMSFDKSFARLNGQPLDSSEVYYSLDAAKTYAASAGAYVGQKIVVIDKNFTFGIGGALYAYMKVKIDKEIYGFVAGLGGRDITPDSIIEVYEKTKEPVQDVTWIGLEEE